MLMMKQMMRGILGCEIAWPMEMNCLLELMTKFVKGKNRMLYLCEAFRFESANSSGCHGVPTSWARGLRGEVEKEYSLYPFNVY